VSAFGDGEQNLRRRREASIPDDGILVIPVHSYRLLLFFLFLERMNFSF
jgi:hypothetical protein